MFQQQRGMAMRTADPGRAGRQASSGELKYRDEGPAKHQWIGVAPEHPVDLRMHGPVDGKEMAEG